MGGTASGSPQRADYLVRKFIEKGYNTNYCQSWYMCRTGIRLMYSGAGTYGRLLSADGLGMNSDGVPLAGAASTVNGYKALACTIGPMTRRRVQGSYISPSTIPLLADAALSDRSNGQLTIDLKKSPGTHPYDPLLPDRDTKIFGLAGDNTAESFQDGPATYVSGSSGDPIKLLSCYIDMTAQLDCEKMRNCGPFVDTSPASGTWGQDIRDYGCVHGPRGKRSCNVLMADGAVKEFVDLNADGYLNPGFPMNLNGNDDSRDAPSYHDRLGYRDSTTGSICG